MKKKTIKAEVITTVTISIVLGMLVIQLIKLEPPMIQPIETSIVTEIHIESIESFQSSIVPLESATVEIQNVVPVPSILYDIPLSDRDQLLIREISNQFGIDNELLLAIIKTESEFNQNNIGDGGKSFGLMQVQPKYWTSNFNEYGCSNWFDIRDNVTVGCSILQHFYQKYGQTALVLNAYNSNKPNNYNGYSDRVLSNLVEIHNLKR